MSRQVNPYAFDGDFDLRKLIKHTTVGVARDEEVLDKHLPELRHILEASPVYGSPPEPSHIYKGVFVGTVANAENKQLLKRIGITHILNCDGIPVLRPEREARYTPEWGITEYQEILAQDGETYDIAYNFPKAFRFLDSASAFGKVLIYSPGVDRSGAIALGYMLHKGIPLLEAAKILKHKRKSALFNKGFMKQLILYAKDHNLIQRDFVQHHMKAEQFARIGKVKHRPRDSHLLQFI